jgi:hypothetical protein
MYAHDAARASIQLVTQRAELEVLDELEIAREHRARGEPGQVHPEVQNHVLQVEPHEPCES